MTSAMQTDNSNRVSASGLWIWAVLAAALAVYLRGIDYGMVNWDDALARRELFAGGVSLSQLVGFFVPAGTTWQPVRELATVFLAVLPDAWGWVPYHVFSVGLFLGSVALLNAFLRRLFARERFGLEPADASLAALAGSLIFALHPSHAEVVAWTLGQKDVLVGFFFIASLYFYTRSESSTARERMLCLLCYGLALGSKPSAVSLPLVLVAYDWFFRPQSLSAGRSRRGTLAFYSILLLPAVAAGLYFLGTTVRTGAVLTEGGLFGRLGRAAGALAFSTYKLALPLNLVHRYPAFDFAGLADFRLWVSLGFTAALLGVAARAARNRLAWGFFLAWFVLALLPNLNLVPIRIERADRYYYLSSYAFAALAGWAFARLYARAGGQRAALAGAGMAAVLALAGLCFVQVGYWKDGPTLWGRVTAIYPEMPLGHVSLGKSFLQLGQDEQALRAYAPLLQQNPPNLAALAGSAVALAHQGRLREARALLELGVKLAPQDPGLDVSLARLLLREGDYSRADSLAGRALSHEPDNTAALLVRARLCTLGGRNGEALNIYRALDPGELDAEGLEFMGAHSFGDGDYERAEGYFRRVVQLQPGLARAWNNLAVTAENRGELARADSLYARAVALDSLYADALFNRGNVLLKLGRADSARALYARADSLSGGTDTVVIDALERACLAAGDSAAAAVCAVRLKNLDTEKQ